MSSKDYKQTNKVNWRHVSLGEETQRERETEYKLRVLWP